MSLLAFLITGAYVLIPPSAINIWRRYQVRQYQADVEALFAELDESSRCVCALQNELEEIQQRSKASIERWKKNNLKDPENQMRFIEQSDMRTKPLMNKTEYAVFKRIEQKLQKATGGFRIMAQVSMGEFLTTRDDNAYRSVSSKRADALVIGPTGRPLVVIEVHGSGHFQGNFEGRDKVKRRALEKAGVELLEIFATSETEQDYLPRFERMLRSAAYRSNP